MGSDWLLGHRMKSQFQHVSRDARQKQHVVDMRCLLHLHTCCQHVVLMWRSHPGPFCMKSYTKILLDYISGARFKKEVQLTLSLNLNSELSYSEMGNSEFAVTEQLKWVSLLNSEGWLWVMCSMTMKSHDQRSTEIMIHHGNSSRQKVVIRHHWQMKRRWSSIGRILKSKTKKNDFCFCITK